MTATTDPGQVYCPGCGRQEAEAATSGTPELLRRTVSVLFVDIVGFTAIVDELDCADVRALQDDYFAVVSAVVRAHGGVVEKYVGDAVMAVFGAGRSTPPGSTAVAGSASGAVAGSASGAVAGSASGAVVTGLAVQREVRNRLIAGRYAIRTRVGVATGDAIIDVDQARHGGQAMISGSVVSLAARLQAYAPHGTVVVCATTRSVTDDLIAYQDLPPATVAGKREPVQLWRALSPRLTVNPRRARGSNTVARRVSSPTRSASGRDVVLPRGVVVAGR